MEKKTLYIIDGSAYIYRAYHAVAPLTNSKGLPTNAVFGFANMIRRLLKEKNVEYLAVAFDSRGPVFRHEMYPEYKANRPPMPEDLVPQIPYIKDLVRGYNLVMFEEERYEADDIIASLCKVMKGSGNEVVIVSGDKDLLQLVDDQVGMLDPMKNKLYDPEGVVEKYNLPPDKLLDYFSLVGDSSDNVPGVPGVGPKTADKLINEYGTLEGLYERVEEMKKSKMKEKIIANKEMAFLSRDLIRLNVDVEVPGDIDHFLLGESNQEKLNELFGDLEFTSMQQEVASVEKISTDKFKLLDTPEKLSSIKEKIDNAAILVIDTETTSLHSRNAELVGLSLCVDLEEAWYIPIGHRSEEGALCEKQLDIGLVQEFLEPYLVSSKVAKLAHNLKYDLVVLDNCLSTKLGGPLLDTMIAAYLLEPGKRSYKLDDLCHEQGVQLTSFTEVVGKDKREDCFAYVDINSACNYSCEDVYGSLLLWQKYEKQLEENDLLELFHSMEMEVVKVLAEMEWRGVCLDGERLKKLSAEFGEKLSGLEHVIYTLAGEEFNVNSPKQLGLILFDKLGLPYGRKTKTGYSTDVKVLEKLAPKHELPAKVLEYRTISKLQSTYVEKLGALIDSKSGRIHTSFNQTVTATGRLSSSNPNLQNIPIRTEEGNRIRKAFVPGKDKVFLSADYSQIDLRVLAHYSQDTALLKAFNEGHDIHENTARLIFSNPLFIAPEMRRVAKSINFGIVYGMSAFGLSNQLGLGRKEAQTFIDRYFAHYSGVREFMEKIKEQARVDGYVTTLCKRRRPVPEIHAKNKNLRENAERIALNTPIQGTAADIIKLAMINVEKMIKDKRLETKLLLQIHDELVFELPEAELDQATAIIKEAMETPLKLDVPLVVNVQVGSNLAKGE